MVNPLLGQINSVGFNFNPRDWALCAGSILAISQNSALFALLGCQFGGDCRTSFALPDTRGRSMIGVGTGPGLDTYQWGERGGAEYVVLSLSQMPIHSHSATFTPTGSAAGGQTTAEATVNVITNAPSTTTTDPTDAFLAAGPTGGAPSGRVFAKGTPNATMAPDAVSVTVTGGGGGITGGVVTVNNNGGSHPVPTVNPYVAVYQVISMQGIFPSRN